MISACRKLYMCNNLLRINFCNKNRFIFYNQIEKVSYAFAEKLQYYLWKQHTYSLSKRSFFGPPKNVNLGSTTSTSKNQGGNDIRKKEELLDDDSPIKKTPRRRTRAIESDSENEDTQQSAKSESEESPERKKVRIESPKHSDVGQSHESPLSKPSTSKRNVGFSPETVPPLRKTARKQMQRKADSAEDHQMEVIRKLKTSPKKEEKKVDEKTPKRTNCLDKFVFVKTPRNTGAVSSNSTKNVQKTESKNNDDTPTPSENKHSPNQPVQSECEIEPRKPLTPSNTLSPKTPKSSKKKSPKSTKKKSSPKSTKKNSKSKISSPANKINDNKNSQTSTSPNSSSDNIEEPENTSPKSSHSSISPNASPIKSPTTGDSKTDEAKAKSPIKNPFAFGKSPGDKGDKEAFNPSKHSYHPIDDASWKRGEDVPFAALSKTFEIIEDTSGRLKTIEILSNFLRSVIVLSPDDFLFCIYLCLNKVAPSFEGIELGVGDIYVCRAIAQATGRSVNAIKSDVSEKGDLGIVAEQSKSNQRMMFQPARLTVKKVFKIVKEIALMSGQASQNKKIDKIKSMFVACKGSEARYLIRFFGGKLRIGLAEQSVLQAIAQACFLTPPAQSYPPEILNRGKGLSAESLKSKVEEYASILKTTYCECPSFDCIIPVLLEKGMTELPNHCKLEPGVPLKPMLAHPTKGVSEVLKRFEKSKFTCEFKYDGERAQIHMKEDGSVSIFSRNQENNTSKYPDIINRLKGSLGPDVKSCVLDSEAVAFDVKESKILPFQILSTRKRKDATEAEIKVQVCVFPFDLLYLNGRNLVTEPFEVRRDLLRKNFIEHEGQFTFAKSMDSTNTEDIEEFLDESIKGNCEGLMVKSLDVDATYEIAKRSRNWLKLKKDYLEGVGDTIDVVVIGGFVGKGKRTGAYGGFLLACYDPENEEFQSLCKIGTGFTEEDLQQHTTFFKDHVIDNPKSYYRYDNGVAPDHWFDAVQVWEIKCADLSISPVHKAAVGIVDPEKGISLRFPRFLKIRDDKTPEDATSASQIADLYRNQDQIKNQTEGPSNDEDFY